MLKRAGIMGVFAVVTLFPFQSFAQDNGQKAAEENGLKKLIVVKQELSDDVLALKRIAKFQRKLLELAKTDPDAAREGRQAPELCIEAIGSKKLCAGLSASYGGTPR